MAFATIQASKPPSRGVHPIAVTPDLRIAVPDLTASATPTLITLPSSFGGAGVVGIKTEGRFRGIPVPIISYEGDAPTLSMTTNPVVQLVGVAGTVNEAGDGLDVRDMASIGDAITLDFGQSAEHVLVGSVGKRRLLPVPTAGEFPGIDLQGWPLVFASIVTPAVINTSTNDPTLQLGLRLIN